MKTGKVTGLYREWFQKLHQVLSYLPLAHAYADVILEEGRAEQVSVSASKF